MLSCAIETYSDLSGMHSEDADLTTLGFGELLCSNMSGLKATAKEYKATRVQVRTLTWLDLTMLACLGDLLRVMV